MTEFRCIQCTEYKADNTAAIERHILDEHGLIKDSFIYIEQFKTGSVFLIIKTSFASQMDMGIMGTLDKRLRIPL